MEALARVLLSTKNELECLRTREQYIKNHLINLNRQLEDRTLTRERRRQLKIQKEDFEEELTLNTQKQVIALRDIRSILLDQRDLERRLQNEARKN